MPTAFVTGANRGIGLEFVRQYAAEGWDAIAACRNPERTPALRRLAGDSGGRIVVVQLDVTDSQSIRRASAAHKKTAIDVLVNNAGIAGGARQRVGSMDYDSWAEILNVNTLGPMRVTEAFLEQVARSDLKCVVAISSGMASIGDNRSGGNVTYRSAKAALNQVMCTLAIDLAPRAIVCAALNPGWVRTDMGGSGAAISAEESVAGMRKVIAALGPAQSGKFFHYTGREYPW